ncbi:MAG TPA: hypothetical protein VFE33_08680 [Thermoanaerobaculia bacterium]|nr:hypothetical protein [Thermoanaerobaculia bacterium]
MNRSLCLAATLALVFLVAGCSKGNSPTDLTSPDSIAITSITPAVGTKLAPGSTVTFTATVSYSLVSASSGTITLVIENQSDQSLTTTQPQMTVANGSGTASLTGSVTVPATGVTTIQVFFPLTPAGSTGSPAIAAALYPVGT